MLRAFALAVTLVAVAPSASALAAPTEAPANGAPVATETQSGTTTYFGKVKDAAKSAPSVAAKAAPKPRPLPPTLTASIDLSRQTMTVSIDGEQRYRWPISSGTSRYPTPTGNFMPQRTAKMWYSKQYDNAPMPNAVFINGGVAVHGTFQTAALGSPASHGCIRLSPANAKTFYSLVERHSIYRTRVSVRGRPRWRDNDIANRRDRRDNEYASNDNGWFWGGSSRSNDDRYDDDRDSARKRERKNYTYAYVDGVRTKVYRRSNGGYAYKDVPKRKRSSQE